MHSSSPSRVGYRALFVAVCAYALPLRGLSAEVEPNGVLLDASVEGSAPSAAPSTPACDVRLSKLSYDDPGVDDNEWLELRVLCAGELPSTLGAAGVTELVLFNGGSAGCPVYRRISLATVPLGPQGYSVVCGAQSELDLDLGCEQTQSGTGPLGQGWLQNGPDDGLLLLDAAGVTLAAYVYSAAGAGQGSCPEAIQIPLDPGPSMGDDSAVVACADGYAVVPLGQAPLRASVDCSALAAMGEPASTRPTDAGAAGAWGSTPSWPTGTVRNARATHVQEPPAAPRTPSDAGAAQVTAAANPPPELGCGFTTGPVAAGRAGAAASLVLAGLATTSRRLRRRRYWR